MVVLPAFGTSACLPEGDSDGRIMPSKPGEYEFACQMGHAARQAHRRVRRALMNGGRMRNGLQVALKEIVMGLRWRSPEPDVGAKGPANLDAQCVMFDKERRVVEVVDLGRLRNANGSVLHTGDSRTGGSEWDNERIFVFLEALPDSVCSLAFVVKSADGRRFGEVPGASCHVSDRLTEHEWLRLDLTSLGRRKQHRVAMLRRSPAGWRMSPRYGRQAHRADL
jgi:stress response protein SCP2